MLRVALLTVVAAAFAFGCSRGYVIWMIMHSHADPRFRFVVNHKTGYIDQTGTIVVPAKLPTTPFNLGGEFHHGVLDPPIKPNTPVYSEGLAAAPNPNGRQTMGYIDRRGRFVIPPKFVNA